MNYYSQNIAQHVVTANNTSVIGGFAAYASRNTHVVIDLIGWAGTQDAMALDCVKTFVSNTVWQMPTLTLQSPPRPAGYTIISRLSHNRLQEADWAINGMFSDCPRPCRDVLFW